MEQRPFNRERFLLRLVAVVLIAEVSLYSFGAGVCAWRGAQQLVPQGGCVPALTTPSTPPSASHSTRCWPCSAARP
ncbi:hypothetical protein [Cyanobium sp. ATX-6F1]|uniref:hypothetical protein n=1 Tax=Cyanobium sp. ATX-6F1 TaxID=3137388 RepID=UPI0039BDFE20